MTTENALAGGDATSAQVAESTAPATDEAQTTSAPDTQAEKGSQTDANGDGKSSEAKNPGESDAAKNTDKGKTEEPKRNRAQERINDLTQKRRDAERRAAAAEAELARLKKPLPMRQDMTDEERDRVANRQAYREEMAENAEANVSDASRQAGELRRQIFEAKVEAIKDRAPDALAKFYAVPCSPMMADYLAETDKAGELAAHLGSNPHEARRIADLPPARQAIELAKIEGKLSSAVEVRRVSQAPEPSSNRLNGGSSPAPKDPSKMSMQEYRTWREKQG